MVTEKNSIDARGTFCSIIKDDVIVPDDIIDVCTIGKQNKQYRFFLFTFAFSKRKLGNGEIFRPRDFDDSRHF